MKKQKGSTYIVDPDIHLDLLGILGWHLDQKIIYCLLCGMCPVHLNLDILLYSINFISNIL